MENKLSRGALIILFLALLDCLVWGVIFLDLPKQNSQIYFLDVGQGDSELVILPGGVKILTDAGLPDQRVVQSIEKALSPSDRYIDLAVISHPQLDHFGGFLELLKRYKFGAIIINGRSDTVTVKEWPLLLAQVKAQGIPLVTLKSGDRITYNDNHVDFIAPDQVFLESAELNDTGLVELIRTPDFSALLTADIGENVEQYLIKEKKLGPIDVLKVPHHGSKYSSSAEFLATIAPRVSVIEVGNNNRYGHPAPETLAHLQSQGIHVFRTDQNGTVRVVGANKKLQVFTERQ